MKISEQIRDRLRSQGLPFRANDNISAALGEGDRALLEEEVRGRVTELLESLVIDVENDPNTAETASRIAKMFLREVFVGLSLIHI